MLKKLFPQDSDCRITQEFEINTQKFLTEVFILEEHKNALYHEKDCSLFDKISQPQSQETFTS